MPTQQVYLMRHGETEWRLSGQHTGVTDIPLSENGRNLARLLAPVLAKETFALVLTSPLKRVATRVKIVARRVEKLGYSSSAGTGDGAEIERPRDANCLLFELEEAEKRPCDRKWRGHLTDTLGILVAPNIGLSGRNHWRARRDLNPQPSDPKNGARQNRMDSGQELLR